MEGKCVSFYKGSAHLSGMTLGLAFLLTGRPVGTQAANPKTSLKKEGFQGGTAPPPRLISISISGNLKKTTQKPQSTLFLKTSGIEK